MAAPQVLPEQEKPKSKKPQVAEKAKPGKEEGKPQNEESKPLPKEISFTIDEDSMLMASLPDNVPEQPAPEKPKGQKPQVAEKTKPKREKPFEPVGERNALHD